MTAAKLTAQVLFSLTVMSLCGVYAWCGWSLAGKPSRRHVGEPARGPLPESRTVAVRGGAFRRLTRGTGPYSSGAVGFGIGLIQILSDLDESSAIIGGMAVALLCPPYSLIGAEGILRPMAHHLEHKIQD